MSDRRVIGRMVSPQLGFYGLPPARLMTAWQNQGLLLFTGICACFTNHSLSFAAALGACVFFCHTQWLLCPAFTRMVGLSVGFVGPLLTVVEPLALDPLRCSVVGGLILRLHLSTAPIAILFRVVVVGGGLFTHAGCF